MIICTDLEVHCTSSWPADVHLYVFFAQTEQKGPSAQEALVTHRLGPRHAAGEQRAERHLSEGESAREWIRISFY